jgi:hypothetical protein
MNRLEKTVTSCKNAESVFKIIMEYLYVHQDIFTEETEKTQLSPVASAKSEAGYERAFFS